MKRICTDIESSIIWQSQADILLNSVQYDVCSPVDLKFGDRILVVRCVNGAYFLMLLNERTKGLIPACPPEYFSEINWRDAARLLHPMEHILENDSTAMNEADKEVEGKIAKTDCNYTNGDKYSFSNEGDMGVVISKEKGKCSLYNVKEQKEIACVDINATYVETVQFSEDDTYVYIVYEDGLVQRYLSSNLTLNCEVAGLDCITQVIYKKTINGGTKYFFECSEGTYVLAEGEGNLKAEQFIPNMVGVNVPQNKYLIDSSKRLVAFPIYTYQEILGKADKICYDNSLWNN